MEMKKINCMLEIDILGNSPRIILGVLRGAFLGFGCPKRHPDALLAKTMGLTLVAYRCLFPTAISCISFPTERNGLQSMYLLLNRRN